MSRASLTAEDRRLSVRPARYKQRYCLLSVQSARYRQRLSHQVKSQCVANVINKCLQYIVSTPDAAASFYLQDYISTYIGGGVKGISDLVANFYLRSYDMLRDQGVFDLIACNTISEGDTRQVGIEQIVQHGGSIISAHPNMPWPGSAGVAISPVAIYKSCWIGNRYLSNNVVTYISPFLSSADEWTPRVLESSKGSSFKGSGVMGMGFTMSEWQDDQEHFSFGRFYNWGLSLAKSKG